VQVELAGREQERPRLGASLEHRRWCQNGISSSKAGFGSAAPVLGLKVSAK
jgi:hypothetical protein